MLTSLREFLLRLFGGGSAATRVDPAPRPAGLAERIIRAMERKRYLVAREPRQVNIVYVEGMSPNGVPNDDRPNQFNDARFVIRFLHDVPVIAGSWEATTEPGRYWTENRMNAKGAARIAFGQYEAWQVGMHRGDHEALVQTGATVTVHRDNDENYIRPGDATDTGWFGINQHWGYDLPRDDIASASAGCLVGRTREGHREFMRLVKTDERYLADNRHRFSTTILPASEL
jgi:hypothetical protein